MDDSGVQRIACELSLVEKAVKAQLEGKDKEEEAQKRMTLRGFTFSRRLTIKRQISIVRTIQFRKIPRERPLPRTLSDLMG